jgi:hypothetical protein
MSEIDLGAVDVVYLSYDESFADDFFARNRELCPRLARVHGVKGFDAAHKRVAEVSTGSHVGIIDADNILTDPNLFRCRLEIGEEFADCVLSFKSENVINGLVYGNGGIKVWPRAVLRSMRTHEAAETREGAVDFYWQLRYYLVERRVSTTHIDHSPFLAFRAGIREAIKLCMTDAGRHPNEAHPDMDIREALTCHVWRGNIERLRIWCSVGADVEHGRWAMLGARTGCLLVTTTEDIDWIRDFDQIAAYWESEIEPRVADAAAFDQRMAELGQALRHKTGIEVVDLDPTASRFVKSVYRNRRAYGVIVKEGTDSA